MGFESKSANLIFKILVIVGPTSSGKSELAVRLAKKYNGEVISCDSRQVYKGMNLGTGKVAGGWYTRKIRGREFYKYIYKGVEHHQIDFVSPKRQYSAALFQIGARKTIADIFRRGKLPILCGGTGHWIDAVVYNQNIPDVKPNLELRFRLKKKSTDVLYRRLKKLDPRRAGSIDRHNKRRLIRALEIIITTGKPVPRILNHKSKILNPLWLGLNQPQPILFARIKKRLKQRLKRGMLKEIQTLHKQGVSWKRIESFGLEYKFGALFLQKKINYHEMFKQLLLAIQHYSKRQMTWWKRNKEIKWINNIFAAQKLTDNFL